MVVRFSWAVGSETAYATIIYPTSHLLKTVVVIEQTANWWIQLRWCMGVSVEHAQVKPAFTRGINENAKMGPRKHQERQN